MSSYRPLTAVVLAAGEGTRMRSARPKPLHVLVGRPMLLHVLDALSELPVERAVVVVGHGAERVTKTLHEQAPPHLIIDFVEQHVPRGTGDAASVALTAFPDDLDSEDGDIVVLPGDTPLLRPATLAALVRDHREQDAACTILSAHMAHPGGHERIVHDKDERVSRVVEHALATEEEREIEEVNTSIYCFRRSLLAPALRRLSPENTAGEYFLSDVVAVLHDAGYKVVSMVAHDPAETVGVNDRAQLAAAEAVLRQRINDRWMRRGVTMLDPDRTYVDASVRLSPDVTLFPGTMLHGDTVVGAGVRLGPDVRLTDCAIGEGATVEQTVGEHATVGDGAIVGPFASLPPGSHVPAGLRTGAFYTAPGGEDDSG
ncbi:MAG: bifunctional N-acetylglucosamine-1-phosphate uridyltransferase/glucosamine-1-phosphate acetyltransferase [Acidimicrobiia bacterium]|nr:bifunctional N-acetylglucosamine-1-phosphate uridyltransferase/glucosamine-1-phosphate acetyltransferase [Acidimicrobiia bacterium]MBV9043154.1 bifunctional N-acetylglucosamine-1-phosphate uridyltransferase/glucosamine-1-phosphate acetyltransferase [Acidimicrobiia bacterium]